MYGGAHTDKRCFPWSSCVSPQVVKAVEGALVYPLAAKSLGVFKKLVRSDKYVAEMLDVCRQELLVLRERINNGDTVTAVLALLESRAKSKL